ncbi:ATP-binding protein [Streptomyces sporangiiformans]|uniref:ATP-binding protein n=1 Tax=Streptomyces sporangiiformans TaxID=2315329 RepID=A0A505DND3_9ACTN|nr:ATP-binding protein [Streptomyces sporangiiformans]TPQ21791.1 ATP-binding protein [Streptomyces sporangiiformans]
MLRRNAFRLPRHPASVAVARRRVRDHLADWGHRRDGTALEDAVLLVSELATNVVRHGQPQEREFEVAVTALADGSCFIEVSDASSVQPSPRPTEDAGEEGAESGRGLHLVEHLTAAWGVWGRGREGKTVWALVPAG